MARKRKKIGEILVDWGKITPADLDTAIKHATDHGRRLGQAFVELQLASEEDVARALAEQFGMEYVDPETTPGIADAMPLIPEDIVRKHFVLPLGKTDDGRLRVLIHDPLDLDVQDMLRFRLATDIECSLATKTKIKAAVDKLSARGESIDKTVDELRHSIDASVDGSMDSSIDVDGLKIEGDEDMNAPIVRLINLLITEAVRSRASDIHVEPFVDRVRVRYRIDGVCIERDSIPKSMQGAVISRLKIMAKPMDIAQKRVPQDGRIKLKVDDQQIDFRVSCIPSYHGESIVMRILRPDNVKIGVQSMGFEEDDYRRFQKIIRRPNGIFLVTGPTGSGKTTTLYGALQELNRPDKKIITAEDPVEYMFPGMNQCQVNEAIDLTFAKILRAMLRQAPNIILVGEIRDLEVAEVAIQAALTGHLVFSTLHTNDAPSAITRLIDMGVKPFLVASSVQAIMAQRLVRTICKECKEVDPNPDRYILRLVGFDPDKMEDVKIYKGRGCKACHGTGYRGRMAIFEMLEMNNQIRELAFERAPTNKLRQAAKAGGMKPLVADGRVKILKGLTTPEEISRITQEEGLIMEEA